MAVNHHGGRVSDEADVDGGHVKVHGGRVVVGGDDGDGLGVSVLLPQVGQCHPLVRILRVGSRVHGVLGDVAQVPQKRGTKGCCSQNRPQ